MWQSRNTFYKSEKPITNNFFFKKEGFPKLLLNIKLYISLNQNARITNKDRREIFNLSNRVILDEINELIEFQLLKSKGKGKALH